MFKVPEPRELGTSVQESLDIFREERGHFITSCPLVGHPLSCSFYHRRGHFRSVFTVIVTPEFTGEQ